LRTAGIAGTGAGFILVALVLVFAGMHERDRKLLPLGVEDLRRERSGLNATPNSAAGETTTQSEPNAGGSASPDSPSRRD